MSRTPIGTAVAVLAEVWHGLIAAIDRALGYFPERWNRP